MAYSLIRKNNENQLIFITDESGARKIENTTKVIQYLAAIAAERSNDSLGRGFDAKLPETNPILEASGYAQTVRNNNSSRFGKFIKVLFNAVGQIYSAYVERCLIEKSRATHQSPRKRIFIFFINSLLLHPLP